MSFLNKIKVKTGLKQHNRFDLSCKHVTTQDFFRPKVTYLHEMVPTENIEINMSCFSRLDPLIRPMYGHIQIINRAFFVPFRTVFEGWNDFISGNKHTFVSNSSQSITKFINSVPLIKNSDLINMFCEDDTLATLSSQSSYDYYIKSGQYFTLTPLGKVIWDLLNTLGYKLTSCIDFGTTEANDDTDFSALPLLCFAKVYFDWFSNPQYANRDIIAPYFKGDRIRVSQVDASIILKNVIQLTYDNDYFVSAWDKPNSPNGNNLLGATFDDTSVDRLNNTNRNSVTFASGGDSSSILSETPILTRSDISPQADGRAYSSVASFSQLALDMLHRATHYVMRFMASGNRTIDRYFAEYGVKLDSAKLERCDYIGKFDVNFDISDVMQLSPDVDQGVSEVLTGVGNYTGKGVAFSGDTLKFSTDEFGILLIVSYAVPNPNANMYCDGRPRFLQHITKFDFFHGDFDALGSQPVRADELYGNLVSKPSNANAYSPSDVWAWLPRYSEYKCNPQDTLSGMFLFNTQNTLMNSWYLYRRFNKADFYTKHDFNFTQGKASEFKNIWQFQNWNYDHMYTIYNFSVHSWLPMKPMYDIFDFDQEGKDIVTQLGGSKVTD